MNRLFVRTYVVLVLIVLAGVGTATAWDLARRSPPAQARFDVLLETPDVVRNAYARLPPFEAEQAVARDLDVELHTFALDALPPLPPPLRQRLRKGLTGGPPPGHPPSLWVPIPDQQLVVHVIPRSSIPPPIGFIGAAVLLALGVGVASQLRPLERDLAELSQAADAFGHGDTESRVTLGSGSPAADLGGRFNAMADRIQSLLGQQRDLLLAVSHELRTPLNRLRFAIELLTDEPDEAARAAQADALQRDLDELDTLVGELLTWGRLEAEAEGPVEEVDVHALVSGLIGKVKPLRPDLQVEVTGVDGVQLRVDATGYARAVSNLVRNAARHAAGWLAVHGDLQTEAFHLHVDDDGPGIPEEHRERVQEPFVRLDDARSRDAGGTGLGLALASRIAAIHHGTLHIGESSRGGARVTLTVPLTVPDPA